MSARFERTIRAVNRHPRTVIAVCLLCLIASVAGIFFIPFEGSLEIMLPARSKARRTVQFLRDANFADKVAVHFTLQDSELGVQDLTLAMDQLAAEFAESPMIEQIVRFPDGKSVMSDMLFFLDHCGELLAADDLEELEGRLSEEGINRQIRRCYMRLLKPEGSFVQDIIRRDPLNISSVILGRIHRLTQAFGYQATVENGHLIHPDKRHGLLLLQTGVPITDTVGSRELMAFVDGAVDDAPDGMSIDIISGHLHSVSNEKLLKRDVRLTVTIASIGFIILFLGVFRDPRAVVIFLIPAAAVLVSLNVTAVILGRLSYLVIGFGAVMAGIAVDYGIHVYVSNRHSTDAYHGVRRILKPVLLSALTTLSVFVAFFASAIPGYRQLAVFSVSALVLSILAAIFVLPPLMKTGVAPVDSTKTRRRTSKKLALAAAAFFLGSLLIAGFLATGLELETGIVQMDGTPPRILAAEEQFQKLWSGREAGQAIAVVGGATYEEAARRSARLHQEVATQAPDLDFSSLSVFWPPESSRQENLRRWQAFWDDARIEMTRERIRAAAAQYGFAEDAFAPFYELLNQKRVSDRPVDNQIFAQFEERFHQENNGEHWFMSFFPDTPEAVDKVEAALVDLPGGFVASRRALGRLLSKSVSREVFRISGIALVMILGVAFLLMRNIRMSLAALLPAACGVLWLFAFMALNGMALNIANMIAGIVVIGLCIDYGIFMVHGWAKSPEVLHSTRSAVILSAVSTLIGAGVLVFARHPALFSIGVTLVIGIAAGFLAALFGVPGLCMILRIPRERAKGPNLY